MSGVDINLSRAAEINYQLNRGDSFAPPPVSFTIDGSPESFAGSTLKMQVREKHTNTVVKEITGGAGIAVSSNQLQYTISAADMEKLNPGVYCYDVQKTVGSVVSTIQKGTITLNADVTV